MTEVNKALPRIIRNVNIIRAMTSAEPRCNFIALSLARTQPKLDYRTNVRYKRLACLRKNNRPYWISFRNTWKSTNTPRRFAKSAKQFGIYPATVQDHLSALQRKGCLQKQRFLSRSISVPESARKGGIPVIGSVAAGLPLLAQENIEDILQMPEKWAVPGAFLLRVKGDSMVGAHILDGDYVLVHPQPTAVRRRNCGCTDRRRSDSQTISQNGARHHAEG